MEYEIDLRRYLSAILRRWSWIIAAALIAAITAAGVSSLLPKKYTATATILMLIEQTRMQVGPTAPMMSVEAIDAGSRRQGLLTLAQSTTIEAKLPPDVVKRVTSVGYRPGMLVQRKQLEATANGDLVEISATAPSAAQAKELADAWATTYVNYANSLFTDQHSNVQLAGAAVLPWKPTSPSVVVNTLLAAVAGAMLGILAALIAEIAGITVGLPRRRQREQLAKRPSPSH